MVSRQKKKLITPEDNPSLLFNGYKTQVCAKLENYLQEVAHKKDFLREYRFIQTKHKTLSLFSDKKTILIDKILLDIENLCFNWNIPKGLSESIFWSMCISETPIIAIRNVEDVLGCKIRVGNHEYPVCLEISAWATGKDIKNFVGHALPYIKGLQKKYGSETNTIGKIRRKNSDVQKIYEIVRINIDSSLKEIAAIVFRSGIKGAREKTIGDIGKIRSILRKNGN